MTQSANQGPVAQAAPPLSRAARRRLAVLFWGAALLCLGLPAILFMLTRALPNGTVGTGPYALAVENDLPDPVCAIHIGELSAHTALGRNKLGTSALRTGERFTLTGLQPLPYALRAWTCDGRATAIKEVRPAAGESVWRITPDNLAVP